MRFLLIVFLVVGTVRADEQVFSGPQPGEKLPSFKAVGVFDDREGKEFDVVKEAAGKPTLMIFVHEITRPTAALMRGLSQHAAAREKDGLKTYIVWLSRDRTETVNFLKRARMSLGLKTPVVISVDGLEGPGAYGLNRKVGLTILVANEGKATANFALRQPALSDGPKVTEAIAKQVGGKGLALREFEALATGRRADAPKTDQQLGSLMRAVIQLTASEEDVKKAAQAVEKYVGNDQARQKEVARISGVIVEKKYGTEAAQKQAKAWVEKYGR